MEGEVNLADDIHLRRSRWVRRPEGIPKSLAVNDVWSKPDSQVRSPVYGCQEVPTGITESHLDFAGPLSDERLRDFPDYCLQY